MKRKILFVFLIVFPLLISGCNNPAAFVGALGGATAGPWGVIPGAIVGDAAGKVIVGKPIFESKPNTKKLERERLKQEKLERERQEKARLERERLEKERAEKARQEKAREQKERSEKERLERERLEKERLKKEQELKPKPRDQDRDLEELEKIFP